MPKPTATFVPLVTPSPTAEGLSKVDVPRIGVAEAKAMAESGTAVLVDVRTEATYEGRHIAGAISMPVDQVAQRYGELPSDKLVIFYCA
jgi:rhodanese-related sulfurtransferase